MSRALCCVRSLWGRVYRRDVRRRRPRVAHVDGDVADEGEHADPAVLQLRLPSHNTGAHQRLGSTGPARRAGPRGGVASHPAPRCNAATASACRGVLRCPCPRHASPVETTRARRRRVARRAGAGRPHLTQILDVERAAEVQRVEALSCYGRA
eukprot:scaffold41835_cov63-Phaeocystis_antarctica.AAC.1